MTYEEILNNLCAYDVRNPDIDILVNEWSETKPKTLEEQKSCSCDNCFYSRTELANELLKYVKPK